MVLCKAKHRCTWTYGGRPGLRHISLLVHPGDKAGWMLWSVDFLLPLLIGMRSTFYQKKPRNLFIGVPHCLPHETKYQMFWLVVAGCLNFSIFHPNHVHSTTAMLMQASVSVRAKWKECSLISKQLAQGLLCWRHYSFLIIWSCRKIPRTASSGVHESKPTHRMVACCKGKRRSSWPTLTHSFSALAWDFLQQ